MVMMMMMAMAMAMVAAPSSMHDQREL